MMSETEREGIVSHKRRRGYDCRETQEGDPWYDWDVENEKVERRDKKETDKKNTADETTQLSVVRGSSANLTHVIGRRLASSIV